MRPLRAGSWAYGYPLALASIYPQPLFIPVNRSGDLNSWACLQKGPAASLDLQVATGEAAVWPGGLGASSDPGPGLCPGSTCGPGLGQAKCFGWGSGPASPLYSRNQGFGPL